MKVLITGGAGFIGSHISRKLLKEGHEVVIVDNLSKGSRDNVPDGARLVVMDVLSDKLTSFFQAENFSMVVHLSGQTAVDVSVKDPMLDARENVIATVNVLEACRHSNVKRVVFSSTAAYYGMVPEELLPIKETQSAAPMSFYGLTKATIEDYLKLYQTFYGIDYVILRFANVYGERQYRGGVISIFAEQLIKGEVPVIFGDGKQIRDFIYAGDIAEGIYAALMTPTPNVICNLSTQTQTDLNELLALLAEISGQPIKPVYKGKRAGDIFKSELSNQNAKDKLGWQPKVTLKEGLKKTYNYMKEH